MTNVSTALPRTTRTKKTKKSGSSPRTGSSLNFDEMDIKDVWREYKRTGTETVRNWLTERYLHLVRYNAERQHAKLPVEVDVNDLIQAGFFGLLDAIDAFDLDYGVKFETYCAQRIRGAILDELRSMDWVPRLVRARTSKVEGARKTLRARTGRNPDHQELANFLGADDEEMKKLVRDGRAVGVVSLNRKCYETESSRDIREIDILRDDSQANPLTETQKCDLKDLITKGLSRAERLIVILYYYEEMTMKEIGQTLDLSESRVSQMHSSILARLRAHMLHREPEFYSATAAP